MSARVCVCACARVCVQCHSAPLPSRFSPSLSAFIISHDARAASRGCPRPSGTRGHTHYIFIAAFLEAISALYQSLKGLSLNALLPPCSPPMRASCCQIMNIDSDTTMFSQLRLMADPCLTGSIKTGHFCVETPGSERSRPPR